MLSLTSAMKLFFELKGLEQNTTPVSCPQWCNPPPIEQEQASMFNFNREQPAGSATGEKVNHSMINGGYSKNRLLLKT